jgi:uncharacterized membrane protein YdbT with pleckstrin-like domain
MNPHSTSNTTTGTAKPLNQEKTLYSDSPSMFRNRPITFGLVALLSIVGVGIPILLVWWLQCRSTELTITEKRTKLHRGWLSRSITEVWHRDVRNVQLDQSLFQRLVGTGRIGVSSAAQSGIEIDVSGLKDPLRIKQLIDHYRSNPAGPASANE